MMDKNCLNCKYEPSWSDWSGGEYSKCSGACKWDDDAIPALPAVIHITIKPVFRYSDDSGIERNCRTWASK